MNFQIETDPVKRFVLNVEPSLIRGTGTGDG